MSIAEILRLKGTRIFIALIVASNSACPLGAEDLSGISTLRLLSIIESDLTLGSEQVVLPEDNLPKVGLSPPRSTVRPMLRPENLGSTKASELQKFLDEVADSKDEETSQRSFSAAPLTQQEKDGFLNQVSKCWALDAASISANVTVVIAFEMTKAGKVVVSSMKLIAFTNGDIKDAEIAFNAGRIALLKCQKDGYELPVEKYDQWRNIEVKFDPSNMRKSD